MIPGNRKETAHDPAKGAVPPLHPPRGLMHLLPTSFPILLPIVLQTRESALKLVRIERRRLPYSDGMIRNIHNAGEKSLEAITSKLVKRWVLSDEEYE